MDKQLIHDLAAEIDAAIPEIASALEIRSRESVLLELLAPSASAFSILISRKAFSAIKRKLPSYLGAAAAASFAPLGGVAATGVGAPEAAIALTAVEVGAVAYFFMSEAMEISSLWLNFPKKGEANKYLPAASLYDFVSTDDAAIERYYQSMSHDDVAYAASYAAHFVEGDPTQGALCRLYNALAVAWVTGYAPIPVKMFGHHAHLRLSPYAGDNIEALKERFVKDLGIVVKYSGGKLKRLPTLMKLGSVSVTTYNMGVAAYNTASAVCRTIECPAKTVVTQAVVDFILSPSSVEWRLPFTTRASQPSSTSVHIYDLDKLSVQGSDAILNVNQFNSEADDLAEDIYNGD